MIATEKTLNNRVKIILSPHYDDLALSIGGTVLCWQNKNISVEDWIIFSLGNYIAADDRGNTDFSSQQVENVSKQRYREELSAANELGIKAIKRLDCYEAKFRGHSSFIAPSQKAQPLTEKDQHDFKKISEAIAPLLNQPIDLFVPLALQGHYDHILVREAVCSLLIDRKDPLIASIFFYEDLPYAARATWRQRLEMYWLMRRWKLKAIIMPIDLRRKLDLLRHYPSQSDPSYTRGITARSLFIQRRYRLTSPAELFFMITKY